MKYLLYADAVLLAFGAVMVVTLGVVCLLFGIYHDVSQDIRRSLSSLVIITLAFVALTVVAGAASYGIWRRTQWRWLAQAALVIALPFIEKAVVAAIAAR